MNAFEQKMQEVADSIRDKTGGTELIEVNNYPTEIDSIIASELPIYKINATIVPENTGTVIGTGVASNQVKMTLTAQSDLYNFWFFKNWKENDEIISTEETYTFDVDGNKNFIAEFEQILPKYTVTVTASPSEGGTVVGAGKYTHNQQVTLIATPNSGFQFKNWKNGKNGYVISTDKEYSFIIKEPQEYIAEFEAEILMTWEKSNVNDNINELSVNGNNLLGIGNYDRFTYRSTDGKNWTHVECNDAISLSSHKLYSVTGGVFDAFPPTKSGKICTITKNSTDNKWMTYSPNDKYTFYGGAFVDGGNSDSRYGVAFCKDTSISSSTYIYEINSPITGWKYGDFPTRKIRKCITSINNKIYIPGYNSNELLCGSKNGSNISWETITLPRTGTWIAMGYGNNKFVIFEAAKSGLYSEDGQNWTDIVLPVVVTWKKIIYGKDRFVAVGLNKIIMSKNGIDWEEVALPTKESDTNVKIGSIEYVNNVFVLSTNQGIYYCEV